MPYEKQTNTSSELHENLSICLIGEKYHFKESGSVYFHFYTLFIGGGGGGGVGGGGGGASA